MKISFNWLKEYLSTTISAEEAAEILTDTGLEVEKLSMINPNDGTLDKVVVGHVLTAAPHPNADRLKVTTVDVGSTEPLSIVCGAPNVEAGQKVLVAQVGAVLQPKSEAPLKIKKVKIRGEVSQGMICAEDELGLGDSHEGIMVLAQDAQPGIPAVDYLQLKVDYVLEIGLTPNRTDGFSHFGVARDLAARLSHMSNTKVRAQLPTLKPIKAESGSTSKKIEVEIADEDGCGRYAGLQLDHVKVGLSPKWLQNKLRTIGVNTVNNVVDITNLVMHETGQPLHAFDAEKIKGNKIVVKTLAAGTPFTTLDGVERKLGKDDLVICNEVEGMCIAGVFGGLESGVTNETKRVFIESAWFNPVRVRKAAKHHGLNTDSSFRFERGVDPSGTIYALQRAASLMVEICNGTISHEMVDVIGNLPEPVELDFSIDRCNALCGTTITHEELEQILGALDIDIRDKQDDLYRLRVPPYRADVTREVDVVEEILRIYGYNSVPLPERMAISVSIPQKPTREDVMDGVAQILAGRGFHEAMSNGLTRSDRLVESEGEHIEKSLVKILNPLSQELDVLRPHVMDSLSAAAAYNLNRQAERLMLFEYGASYHKTETGYSETLQLCLLLQGNRFAENWNNQDMPFDFSDLRGHVEAVFTTLGLLEKMELAATTDSRFSDAKAIHLSGQKMGVMGKMDEPSRKAYGLKKAIWIAELDMDACMKAIVHGQVRYHELPRYPAVRRDFSLLLDQGITFEDIKSEATQIAGHLLKEMSLFDVYEGKNLPQGKKSYAVKFVFQHAEKTLQDEDVDLKMEAIRAQLETKLGAQLR